MVLESVSHLRNPPPTSSFREEVRVAPAPPRLYGSKGALGHQSNDALDAQAMHRPRSTAERRLSRGTWNQLQQQSERSGVSPEAWLLSALGCWLRRVSGSRKFLLAVYGPQDEASGRTEHELAPMLLSLDLERDRPFQDVVREAGLAFATASRERVTVDDARRLLVEELGAQGTLPVALVLRVARSDLNASAAAQRLHGHAGVVSIRVADDHLGLSLDLDGSTIDPWASQRALEHLSTLIEGALVAPSSLISKLPLLSAAERSLVLGGFQGPPLHYPRERAFHQLFEEQAARRPSAPAVAFDTHEWSYERLNMEANRVARVLQARGVGLESRVGVYMDNSLELAVAVLAVFKAGAAYVPLSLAHPKQHRDYVIADTGLTIVLTQAGRATELADARVEVVELPLATRASSETSNLDVRVHGENLCAVLYTSGTTGTPKGVELSHQSLMSRVFWMQSVTHLDENDRHFLISPMHVARFVGQLMWPLVAGARTYISRPSGGEEGRIQQAPLHQYLTETVQKQQISFVHVGPAMVRSLVASKDEFRKCTSLRHVFVSGEVFAPELQKQFSALIPLARIHKSYGLAETNFVTYCQYGDPLQTPTIGRPTYMRVYVLDEQLEPAPIGMPGELCTSGIGLARGYANKPDVTAQRFVPDPFDGRSDGVLYRTGDLARFLPDGNIEFLGRMDHHVRIGGNPVDLVELESILAQHPALQAAVVVVAASSKGREPKLVTYVVPKPSQPAPASGELEAFLAARVPGSVVPLQVVAVESIPTRASKVDRQGLAASH